MKQNKDKISRYRQEIYQLTSSIKELAIKAGYEDLLLRGVPLNVYRRCGKKGCGCMTDDNKRHGPYQVVQIYKDGKSSQLTLKKSEGRYFKMAEHYQYQMQNRAKLLELWEKLLGAFDQMIEVRTIWNKQKK